MDNLDAYISSVRDDDLSRAPGEEAMFRYLYR
jgi:hypothetical protein